jgi:thiopeptide-type bacteriocin biosynthesis protein
MHTLKKYAIRAATRCTPYGIYAGTAIADIGMQQGNANNARERKVRIDVGFLQTLKAAIERDPAIYPHLWYSVNNSLYRIPGQYRFLETIIENGKCQYQLTSLEHSDLLEEIIIYSREKKLSFIDIAELAGREVSEEEFKDYVTELVRSQFLVSELQTGLTTGDETGQYIDVLKRLKEEGVTTAKKYLTLFLKIEKILLLFTHLPVGMLPIKEINDLKVLLEECGVTATDHLFHADLRQPVAPDFVFSDEQEREMEHGIITLGKLSGNSASSEAEISGFKKLFTEKYETREIPLCEALDPEFGIGFPAKERIGDAGFNPLIESLGLAYENNQKQAGELCHTLLEEKREALTLFINQRIEIKEEDLKGFEDKSGDLPSTFSVMGSLLPGGQILLEAIGATHGNSLAGRFAYLDPEMTSVCKEVSDAEKEANKDVIFAEIVFNPEDRIGNIARRPVLSDYEIPLLARAATGEKQIPVNDLRISIQQGEIILRSENLDRRIIPRLSNAHNYTKSLVPAYRFLCAIQQQGKVGFTISHEEASSKKRFLPRIVYKNFIFQRACWFLYKSDIKSIISSGEPLKELRAYLLQRKVTRFVCFAEGDNELFIDTYNESYLELLLEEIKLRTCVKLVEWLYDTEVSVPVQQFILPLSQKKPGISKQPGKHEASINVRRSFVPGSEWVYFKIYCGSTVSDKILMEVVKPAIESLLKKLLIKKAFFLRYTDPHYHIRFRLHLDYTSDTEPLAAVLKCIYDLLHPYYETGLVWKVQLDTYEREIERYGGHAIQSTEIIFFHDSLLFLNCMQHKEFAEDPQIRFFAALKNIDIWLTFSRMVVDKKADFCNQMCAAFEKEFPSGIKCRLDAKYRELKKLVAPFLKSDKFNLEFSKRDNGLSKIFLPKENLESNIHMSMNRWFITQQRLMEYMCYLFCRKYYHQILNISNI